MESDSMEEKIINTHIKCYLIGAMENTNAKDEGKGWRSRLKPELEKRVDEEGNNVYVFDPTIHEEEKVGMPTKEFHAQMDKWIASGNLQKVSDGMDCIWRGKTFTKPDPDDETKETQHHILGDIDYVRKSNFLILNIDEGDRPCGTYAEAFLAFERKIPIYMITNGMALSKYNKSLLGWVIGSGGGIFPNQKQLLEFLDKEYKLKIKKEKK